MVQAIHGLTMIRAIRLARCVDKRGSTDSWTALTTVESKAVCGWCCSVLLGAARACYRGHRPPAPRIWWPSDGLSCSANHSPSPICCQSASLVLGWCLARTFPRSIYEHPASSWQSFLGLMFHFNHSEGLCSTEKIKAIDKFVQDSPCDHFLAGKIRRMRDRIGTMTFGVEKKENREGVRAGRFHV